MAAPSLFTFNISNCSHLKTDINITKSSLVVLPKFPVLARLQTTAAFSNFRHKFLFSFGVKEKKKQTTETVLLNYPCLIPQPEDSPPSWGLC